MACLTHRQHERDSTEQTQVWVRTAAGLGGVPGAVTLPLRSCCQENIISPVEDSPIPEIAGKDSGADGAGTSPRSQNKPFR